MRPAEILAVQRERILAIAAANGATNVRVFGSAVKGADHSDSDLDLLVEIPPGTSLLRIVGLQPAIEDAPDVRVDLCTDRELHPNSRTKSGRGAAAMTECSPEYLNDRRSDTGQRRRAYTRLEHRA
jgi:predicted nucleotidyltransferase